MFFKILFYVWLSVSILTAITMLILCIRTANMFYERHPDAHPPRSHWTSKVITLLKCLVVIFVPVLHVLAVTVCLFDFDAVCEMCLNKIEEACGLVDDKK